VAEKQDSINVSPEDDGDSNFFRKLSIRIADNTVKGKVKQLRYMTEEGPEGTMKLRFPDFVTTAQDGDKVISLTNRPPLPPGNTTRIHFH